MDDFPWTYDQLQRYSALREFLSVFHPGGTARILDVGGLSPDRTGTGHWLPVRAVAAGEAVVVDLADIDLPGYVRGDGTGLPFEDRSFDVVAALDVLEHVPEDARPKFLSEMVRVSRDSVFLCAPFRGPENDTSDELLSEQLRRVYGAVQEQLREHRLHGLPDSEAIDRQLAGLVPAGGGFSYGSLLTWLPYQSVKNAFMMRLNSGTIHALLDRWMASLGSRLALEPPFARRFWVRSEDIGRRRISTRASRRSGPGSAGSRPNLRPSTSSPGSTGRSSLTRRPVPSPGSSSVSGTWTA